MTYNAESVISIARGEVGYREKKSDKDLYSKTANAGDGNYTKYGYEMHRIQPSNMDFPAAWCDAFVDWCHYQAAGRDAKKARHGLCGDFEDWTVMSAQHYEDAGRYDHSPKRGDQIFFKNAHGICHTGIVTAVSDSKVVTIEGNKANMVKECSYPRGDSRIAGYGHPRYDGTPSPAHKLEVDGKVGPATVREWQRIMGTKQDGVISGQSKASRANHQAINAIKYSVLKRGSDLIRAVQKKVGVKQDGLLGPQTIKAIQKRLGVTVDGYFGANTAKALQKRLNTGKF